MGKSLFCKTDNTCILFKQDSRLYNFSVLVISSEACNSLLMKKETKPQPGVPYLTSEKLFWLVQSDMSLANRPRTINYNIPFDGAKTLSLKPPMTHDLAYLSLPKGTRNKSVI